MSQQLDLKSAATPVSYIYVSDRARALDFYRDALGLDVHRGDDFGDFIVLSGALLRVTVLTGHMPSQHPVLGWNVDDIEATAKALLSRGVAFTRFPGMKQDELGLWTSPDRAMKVAFFTDPDGNVLSLSETRL